MQLENSDDAVLDPSSDSLALLNHPNIRPIVPVAPVPVPGRSTSDVVPANPLTEQRTSWLAAKVAEKLGVMQGGAEVMVASSKQPLRTSVADKPDVSREDIELMALLAVAGRNDESVDPQVAARTPAESRISALSLLAAATDSESSAEVIPPIKRPSALREVPRLPGFKLEPIPVIKPAQEIDAATRTRVLVLLKPDNFAAFP